MNDIIDDLLLLAEVRKAQVEGEPLDMERIVAEALQRLVDMVEQYQADIRLPPDWTAALGYAPWVEEVWANYISNAIKYGGRPPHIELGATAAGRRAWCVSGCAIMALALRRKTRPGCLRLSRGLIRFE